MDALYVVRAFGTGPGARSAILASDGGRMPRRVGHASTPPLGLRVGLVHRRCHMDIGRTNVAADCNARHARESTVWQCASAAWVPAVAGRCRRWSHSGDWTVPRGPLALLQNSCGGCRDAPGTFWIGSITRSVSRGGNRGSILSEKHARRSEPAVLWSSGGRGCRLPASLAGLSFASDSHVLGSSDSGACWTVAVFVAGGRWIEFAGAGPGTYPQGSTTWQVCGLSYDVVVELAFAYVAFLALPAMCGLIAPRHDDQIGD